MFVAPPMGTMEMPSASRFRLRRAASASSASWSLIPSTSTTVRARKASAICGLVKRESLRTSSFESLDGLAIKVEADDGSEGPELDPTHTHFSLPWHGAPSPQITRRRRPRYVACREVAGSTPAAAICVSPRLAYPGRMTDGKRFEELVAEAIDSLPQWV